jgi:hypothetical protein
MIDKNTFLLILTLFLSIVGVFNESIRCYIVDIFLDKNDNVSKITVKIFHHKTLFRISTIFIPIFIIFLVYLYLPDGDERKFDKVSKKIDDSTSITMEKVENVGRNLDSIKEKMQKDNGNNDPCVNLYNWSYNQNTSQYWIIDLKNDKGSADWVNVNSVVRLPGCHISVHVVTKADNIFPKNKGNWLFSELEYEFDCLNLKSKSISARFFDRSGSEVHLLNFENEKKADWRRLLIGSRGWATLDISCFGPKVDSVAVPTQFTYSITDEMKRIFN